MATQIKVLITDIVYMTSSKDKTTLFGLATREYDKMERWSQVPLH